MGLAVGVGVGVGVAVEVGVGVWVGVGTGVGVAVGRGVGVGVDVTVGAAQADRATNTPKRIAPANLTIYPVISHFQPAMEHSPFLIALDHDNNSVSGGRQTET